VPLVSAPNCWLSKVLQRADACVVGYSEEGIASFAGGLNLEIISVDQ